MTIINSFVQGDSAYLLTDTAWVETRTGRVLASAPKMLEGKNFPFAMAVTGDAHIFELINQIGWTNPANAKELVEHLPHIFSGLASLSCDPTFTMAVRLAAWCEHTERVRIFHFDMDPHRCALWGIEPWEVIEANVLVPGDVIAAALPGIDFEHPETLMDPSKFDPERDGLRIMEAQRALVRFPLKGQTEPRAFIGCAAQLAKVTKYGVTFKTLRVWEEDEVGSFLAPTASLEPL